MKVNALAKKIAMQDKTRNNLKKKNKSPKKNEKMLGATIRES